MKKIVLVFCIVVFAYLLIGNALAKNNIIPDEAIRIRVIAASDSEYDQKMKLKVKEVLTDKMSNLLNEARDVNDARSKITNNIESIENSVSNVLKKEYYNTGFTINYGLNYFPEKKFKGIVYKEGYYESLVVTLGEGLGENWWCVLFPPLCLIEADESDLTEVEYTSFIKTIINKYF